MYDAGQVIKFINYILTLIIINKIIENRVRHF